MRKRVVHAHAALKKANANVESAIDAYKRVMSQQPVSEAKLKHALKENRTKPVWDGSRPLSRIRAKQDDADDDGSDGNISAANISFKGVEREEFHVNTTSQELIKANENLAKWNKPIPKLHAILDNAQSVSQHLCNC